MTPLPSYMDLLNNVEACDHFKQGLDTTSPSQVAFTMTNASKSLAFSAPLVILEIGRNKVDAEMVKKCSLIAKFAELMAIMSTPVPTVSIDVLQLLQLIL